MVVDERSLCEYMNTYTHHIRILSNDNNQSYGKFIKCQKKYDVYLYIHDI